MGILLALVSLLLDTPPPAQPIPYSHKTHLARGLKCQECHPNPDPGEHMTLPAAAKCKSCHPAFAKLQDPIPWVRIYVVPGDVYWNHRSHLEAKMTCQMCHGDVAQMDVTTKATNAAFMDGCITCHRQQHASTGCEFCHEAK